MKKDKVLIRRATINDLSSICDLSQLLFEHQREFTNEFNMSWSYAEEGRKSFTKRLKGKKSFVLVAQDEKKAVGYITVGLEKLAWRAFNPIAEVVNLSVAPQYRGRGIGSKLFQEAKKIAIKRGAKRISVSALSDNIRALKFYHQQGFKDLSISLIMKID